MERKRKAIGERYYYVDDSFAVNSTTEDSFYVDESRFKVGNYFDSADEAEAFLKAIKGVVIEKGFLTDTESTLNEYQRKAMTTCMPTCDNFSYMFLNLVGEVGEFSSKVAKAIRKGEMNIYHDALMYEESESRSVSADDLKLEAGDILWQLAGLCSVFGWELQEIADMNIAKLASRKERGKIDGNGDNR